MLMNDPEMQLKVVQRRMEDLRGEDGPWWPEPDGVKRERRPRRGLAEWLGLRGRARRLAGGDAR
jgi:hypothetical protein